MVMGKSDNSIMQILFIAGQNDEERLRYKDFVSRWLAAFHNYSPELKIAVYPDGDFDPDDIEIVLIWKHPYGLLNKFKNLKAIQVMAAGVDHALGDKELPNVPIARIVDPDMAKDLAQYAAAYVLKIIKRVDHWQKMQQQHQWAKQPPFNFSQLTIGVMGLGAMGRAAATMLANLDLQVIGWSRSSRSIENVECYAENNELGLFLSRTDILICMLPLTEATRNILNLQLFKQLKPKAYIMNLGRGGHLIEEDLLFALENGILSGAILDVFRVEPLPADHPFWSHPLITVTPHIASMSNPDTAINQVVDNIYNVIYNQPLTNMIDII